MTRPRKPPSDTAGQCALIALPTFAVVLPIHGQSYKYFRLGNTADTHTTPVAGYALMGGGKDLDDAFKWLCDRASGGDFLVLCAHDDDDYNPYQWSLHSKFGGHVHSSRSRCRTGSKDRRNHPGG